MENGDDPLHTPKNLTEIVYDMLNDALDCGITESAFWEMTVAEIRRAFESAARVKKAEAQQMATYQYIQANLIIKGVSKVLGDKSSFPTLEEAYSGLFDDMREEKEEAIHKQKMNLSALRFKQFAQSYNSNFKKNEGVAKINYE